MAASGALGSIGGAWQQSWLLTADVACGNRAGWIRVGCHWQGKLWLWAHGWDRTMVHSLTHLAWVDIGHHCHVIVQPYVHTLSLRYSLDVVADFPELL